MNNVEVAKKNSIKSNARMSHNIKSITGLSEVIHWLKIGET